jgi:hypothetical protein
MKVDYYQPHQRESFHPKKEKKKKKKKKKRSQQIKIAKDNVDLRDKLAE